MDRIFKQITITTVIPSSYLEVPIIEDYHKSLDNL